MLLDECLVLPSFLKNQAHERSGDDGVPPRRRLQKQIGMMSSFRAARIDTDQFESTRFCSLQHPRGILTHDRHRGMRDERVRAEEKENLRLIDVLQPGSPASL